MRLRVQVKRILLTLATLGWMGLIFGFSSDTAEESAGLSAMVCRFLAGYFMKGFENFSPAEQDRIVAGMQYFVRKGAHVTEYMILGILLVLTLLAYGVRRAHIPALCAGAIYAALDEYHQRFVSGRSGEVKDVLIDTCGVLLGLLAAFGAGCLIQIIKEKGNQKRTEEAGPQVN